MMQYQHAIHAPLAGGVSSTKSCNCATQTVLFGAPTFYLYTLGSTISRKVRRHDGPS
jgi:hypothetical protein